jgi:predicted transcriptional regulator
MIALDLIQDDIPVLNLSDDISTAVTFFDDYKLHQIPVFGESKFLGLIDEGVILNAPPKSKIKDLKKHFRTEEVLSEKNLFDVLHFFRHGNLSVLPVVDKNNKYLGCIHERILLQKVCETLNVEKPGGIIHLQVRFIDYSLAQIAQIVEGNGAKILCSLCLPNSSNTKLMELLIKINQEELSGIIQTFQRYEYKIIASFHKNIYKEGLSDRLDSFIRYLNI